MKHYRILEMKDDQKSYIIQYLKPFFGLFFWKKANDSIYTKYDEALNDVKKIINQEDYDTKFKGYHYIDAYKLFKPRTVKEVIKEVPVYKEVVKEVPVYKEVIKEVPVKEIPLIESKNPTPKKPTQRVKNKSVFVPKNK